MRRRVLVLVALGVLTVVWGEYPSGYFYAIYRGDTFCVRPVITDSVTEAEWFDYTSSSIHTGLETAYETHFFFFYNPLTGRIGFVTQHNIDDGGTENAWCEMYLDGIPPACSVLVSDDPSHSHSHSTGRPCGSAQEFNLDCYPQGGWEWYNNTDGGAMSIPRSEWQFTIRVKFGGWDPIHTMWFLSGDDGGDRIMLDTVITGQEDTIIVGHGFLQLLTFVDSIWFDSTNIYTADTFHFPVCNSDETIDTLHITSITLSHPEAFTVLHYPTTLAPGECDDIIVEFHPNDTGTFYDTLVISKLIPCDSVTYVPVVGRGIQPRIDSVWFSEETDCDGQNIVEVCYHLYGEAGEPNPVSVNFSHDSLGGIWFNFADYTVEDTEGDFGDSVYPGVHCFNWILSEDIPGFEVENLQIRASLISISDTFAIIDSIDISSRPRYGHGLAYGDGYYWIYDQNTRKIYKAECLDYTSCPPIDSFFVGLFNCDIDYYDGYIYYSTNASGTVADDTIKRLNVEDGSSEIVFVFPGTTDIEGVQVAGGFLYASFHSSTNWFLGKLDLSTLPATELDTIITTGRDTCFALMEGLAMAFGYLWGCNNDGFIGQFNLTANEAVGCHSVPNIGYGAEGLCWDGEYLWYQNNEMEQIYQITILDSTSNSISTIGPVDSRSPEISVACPADTVFFNDTILITYEKDDLFPNSSEPETIIVYYYDGADTIIGEDSVLWMPPLVNCDSAYIAVAAPDSFCNWGYDTCRFTIMATGSLMISLPETSASPCDTINIPLLCGDRFYPIMNQLEIWIRFNPTVGIPIDFIPAISPTPDSSSMEIMGDLAHIYMAWVNRTVIDGDTLGYLSTEISCDAVGGDVLPLFVDSTYTDIIDLITDDGYVAVNYNPSQWLTNLWFTDTARGISEHLEFGSSYTSEDTYDPASDILYVTPPPSGIDVWFAPDSAHPVYRLQRDMKDMVPENVWYVIINYDQPLYVHWDKNTFDEGLYILNGFQDMRADTDYYAAPYETLTITWDLPELHPQMLHLYPGWNLISMPVYNPSGGVTSLMAGILAGPYGYDAFAHTFYYADDIQPGAGYWVFADREIEIPVLGVAVHQYRIDVAHGWNLVGATFEPVPVDSAAVEDGAIMSAFEYAPDIRSYVPADTLEPFKGYWLYISGDGRILFVPGE